MNFDTNKSYTTEELRTMAVEVKKELSAAEAYQTNCNKVKIARGQNRCDVCAEDVARLKNQQMLIGRQL